MRKTTFPTEWICAHNATFAKLKLMAAQLPAEKVLDLVTCFLLCLKSCRKYHELQEIPFTDIAEDILEALGIKLDGGRHEYERQAKTERPKQPKKAHTKSKKGGSRHGR